MNKRKLGGSGLEVTPLCLGGNVFGWTADEATSFAILDDFVEAGGNFVDTANVYSRWVPGHRGGESETIIGKWFERSGKRGNVVLATKAGAEMGPGAKGLSKAYLVRSVEDSLQRLQTDYIDLFQSHYDDAQTPIEETLRAYDDLIRTGKIRAIGASNFSAERLSKSLDVSKENGLAAYTCLQPHYNLYTRSDYETGLEPLCTSHGLGVIPYYGLASGFLSGKYRTEADLQRSPRGRGVQKYLNERGFRILKALDGVAARLSSTPAQVALAWLMARPSITAPIASATSVEQLKDLLAAVNLKLDGAAIAALDEASA